MKIQRMILWFPVEPTFILYLIVFHPASRYLLSSSYVQALGYVERGVGSSSALVLITWPSLGLIFPV